MKYDLIVYGGGTSGVAAAYIAAKKGINTLLIEKTSVLGGSITQGLVVPSMQVETEDINRKLKIIIIIIIAIKIALLYFIFYLFLNNKIIQKYYTIKAPNIQ